MRANFQLLSLWSITNGAPKAREILGFYTRFLWFPYYLISIYLITWTSPRGWGVDCSNLLIRHFFEINLLIKKTGQICPPQAEIFGISCELTVKYSCFWTVRAGFPLSFHKNMVKLSRVVNACPWERFRWQCTSPPPGISTLYDFFRVYSSLFEFMFWD